MDLTSLTIVDAVGLATALVFGLTRLAARYCAIPARRAPDRGGAGRRPPRRRSPRAT